MSDRLQDAADGRAEPERGFSGWIVGRANRKNYWLWMGPTFVGAVVLGALGVADIATLPLGLLMTLLFIRRFHDFGRTGWWAPVINIIMAALTFGVSAFGGADLGSLFNSLAAVAAVIVLGSLPGQPHANRFGSPPGKPALAETFS